MKTKVDHAMFCNWVNIILFYYISPATNWQVNSIIRLLRQILAKGL